MITYLPVAVAFLTLVGAIISVYNRLTNEISIIKEKQINQCKELENARAELRIHEQINERTFEKIFDSLDTMKGKLDKLIGFFEGNGTLKP